jgi:signal transduction histidine kinase
MVLMVSFYDALSVDAMQFLRYLPLCAAFRRAAQALMFVPVICAAYCTSCYEALSQPARMLDSLTELLRSAELRHNDTLAARTLLTLTESLRSTQPYNALKYALRAVEYAEQARLVHELLAAYKLTSIIQRSIGDEAGASVMMANAEQLCYSKKDTTALMDVYNATAGSCYSRGVYPQALEWWLRGLSLAEQGRNRRYTSKFLNNIAHVYLAQKQYGTALQYFQRAIAIAQQDGVKRDVALFYGNIGSIYSTMKRYDSAMDWHFRALAVAQSINDKSLQGMVFTNLGMTHHALGHFQQALEYFQKAMTFEKSVAGTITDYDITLNAAATTCLALGKPREAIAYAQEVVRHAEPSNARPMLRDAYETLAYSYAAVSEFQQAYRYQAMLTALKDSLLNAEGVRRVAEVQARYEIQKRQQEIALLSRQKESRSRFLYAALVALALLIAFLLALWNRYRLKHRSESALQQANELLADRNEELATLNDEKNELLGIAAHDLKNPLAAIMLSAQMSERAAEKNNLGRVKHHTRDIETSVYQMLRIINNILDVNKIESGVLAMHLEPVECASILAATAEVYEERATQKNIIVHLDIPNDAENASLLVLADYAALAQTLDNLVSNAIKYSPPSKTVTLAAERMNDMVCVSVRDEGPGMSQEDKQHLFRKFARLSAKPTGGESSTGLGLSIVKKLVEAMNGRVWCESTLGAGATFMVALPIAEKS